MHAANTIVYPTHYIIFNVVGTPAFVAKHIAAMRKPCAKTAHWPTGYRVGPATVGNTNPLQK